MPGITAEIPIRASLFRPLVRFFRKTPSEKLVQVISARGIVHIQADDEGTADVYLAIVNMTDRSLRVDDLHLEVYYTGGITAGVAQPLFTPPAKLIPPFSTNEINLTIHLGAGAIRATLQRMQKAQNVFSSPGIWLTVGGKLDLFIPGSFAALQRARTIRLPFQLEIRSPELHINCPAMKAYTG